MGPRICSLGFGTSSATWDKYNPGFHAIFEGFESFCEVGVYKKICDQNGGDIRGVIILEALQYTLKFILLDACSIVIPQNDTSPPSFALAYPKNAWFS